MVNIWNGLTRAQRYLFSGLAFLWVGGLSLGPRGMILSAFITAVVLIVAAINADSKERYK
jgi:hypothetical protein